MKDDWRAFLEDAGAEFDGSRVRDFGNPERERRAALGGLVFADLEHLGIITAHGSDTADFLQSQLSNDIGKVDAGHHQLNAFCTPKGRILGLMRVFRRDGDWCLRLPLDTIEAVIKRLRMYVLRADVTLEDASDNFIRIGVSGEDAVDALRTIAGNVPAEPGEVVRAGDLTLLRVSGRLPRFEVYAESLDAARSLWDSLNVSGAPVGESCWRMLEILAGIPSVFATTAEAFVPQMTNLQLVDGVSFKKGCYPGQEIVARMQYLGTLKRRMYLGKLDTDESPAPGDELFPAGSSEQPVGRIVDAQPHPDGGQVALAVLQIKHAEADDAFLGNAEGIPFARLALPYAFEAPDREDRELPPS
jgi:folate-binding protein YgfZ